MYLFCHCRIVVNNYAISSHKHIDIVFVLPFYYDITISNACERHALGPDHLLSL